MIESSHLFARATIISRTEQGRPSKFSEMTDDEMLELLSTDGMLVKRPILIGENIALVGFKEPEWTEKLL